MKKNTPKSICLSACLLLSFAAWTALVRWVDVQPIGPDGSTVGFATLNQYVHNITGVHLSLYIVTDWLGLVPIATALGFAALGLVQWIKRKSLLRVDRSILALGVFYLAVIAAYVCFEIVVINYRPILIDGRLEASYPSSTTMLVTCVMPTAAMQLKGRIKNKLFGACVIIAITVFIAFMVLCRLLSGVHWMTDIIGGAILSTALVLMYNGACGAGEE
ncbi:MAG: phosphatase PAP2 family protein [Clostridia bacterium]|nr:phosphatase PAP2 family protein [Clostridia bacterium]